MKKIIQALSFYPLYLFILLFTRLPLRIQYIFSDFTFILIYYIVRYRRRVVNKNLLNAFPEKTELERKKITRKFYKHLCDTFIESLALNGMNNSEIMKRYTYSNIEVINNLYDRGKGVILTIGHYNNWEWYAGLQLHTKLQILGIYKPLSNPYFNKLIIDLREKYGGHAISITSSLKNMMEYHNKKILTITGFLSDQRPIAKYIEYWTTFLNQETPVQLGAEKIGRKLNYAIVYGHTRKIKRGYYDTEFTLLCENPRETKDFEITEMHTRALEKTIREKPEYWLWSHNRWKHNRQLIEAKKKEEEEQKISL
jgi:Kdo2-lipid IVA lauroyltransferase/acyltransferase